jgi:hypothetical protein
MATTNCKVKRICYQKFGFKGNQQLLAFVNDLYSDYNVNHLTSLQSFTSPISTTGIDVYNYVPEYINKKWCYNIVFYPRRKNELTFKGDFG